MKINHKIIAVLVFSFILGVSQIVNAADYPAYGWAWSSNTGWLRVNPIDYTPPPPPPPPSTPPPTTTTSAPSTSNTVPISRNSKDNLRLWKEAYAQSATWIPLTVRGNGSVFGWGWSGKNQLGWVSFNPADTADCGDNMNVNMLTGQVSGWFKYLAGNAVADGWDGCVVTSGPFHISPLTSGTKGVTVDFVYDRLVGHAWGGEVVGWIKFYSSVPPTYSVKLPDINNGGSASLRVNCALQSAANSSRFTATIVNGSAPYTLSWNVDSDDEIVSFGSGENKIISGPPLSTFIWVGPFVNDRVYSSEEGTKVGVKVTDSTGTTVTTYCPDVTVKGSITQAKLMIGSATQMSAVSSSDYEDCPLLDCLYKRYTIRQGGTFTLKWNQTQKYNASTHQYYYDNCNRKLKLADGSDSAEFPWSGNSNAGPGSLAITDSGTPAAEGRYIFEMNCGVSGGFMVNSKVELDVVSSDIVEF